MIITFTNGVELKINDPKIENQVIQVVMGGGVEGKQETPKRKYRTHFKKENHRKPWTEDDDIRLLQYKSDGLSNRSIGKALGRTGGACAVRLGALKKPRSV